MVESTVGRISYSRHYVIGLENSTFESYLAYMVSVIIWSIVPFPLVMNCTSLLQLTVSTLLGAMLSLRHCSVTWTIVLVGGWCTIRKDPLGCPPKGSSGTIGTWTLTLSSTLVV